jgi:bifunctional non-homologous end joining protein LigD
VADLDRDAPPTGLSRFEELSRREAAQTAILYAIDLIKHDGEDLRDRPFLERKAALARLLRDAKAGILLNEHIVEDGLTVFAYACRLGAEGIVSKNVDGAHQSAPASSTTPIHSAGERSTRYARSDRCAIPTLPLVKWEITPSWG